MKINEIIPFGKYLGCGHEPFKITPAQAEEKNAHASSLLDWVDTLNESSSSDSGAGGNPKGPQQKSAKCWRSKPLSN